jgi:hypothetical protein
VAAHRLTRPLSRWCAWGGLRAAVLFGAARGLVLVSGTVLVISPPAASAAVRDAGPSVFVCYSAEQADPAVLLQAEATRLGVRLYDGSSVGPPRSGYWQPYALDPQGLRPIEAHPLNGSTQLGAYGLFCALPDGFQDTHTAVGGSGEVYDAATVAAYRNAPDGEALGIYEIFGARRAPPPAERSGSCTCSLPLNLLPSGGRPLATSIQLSGCTPHRATPDPACTPGVALYYKTRVDLCSPDYQHVIAPISAAARLRIWASYGLTGRDGYAITRLVPPSLGGTDDDANLWPIKRSARAALKAKRELEDRIHQIVCSRNMSLARAQRRLAHDWQALYHRVFPRAPAP